MNKIKNLHNFYKVLTIKSDIYSIRGVVNI